MIPNELVLVASIKHTPRYLELESVRNKGSSLLLFRWGWSKCFSIHKIQTNPVCRTGEGFEGEPIGKEHQHCVGPSTPKWDRIKNS